LVLFVWLFSPQHDSEQFEDSFMKLWDGPNPLFIIMLGLILTIAIVLLPKFAHPLVARLSRPDPSLEARHQNRAADIAPFRYSTRTNSENLSNWF
jgi:hypothetical protein